LESFVVAALGLTIESRSEDVSQLLEIQILPSKEPLDGARTCAAWQTSKGRVIVCATYHHQHSQRTAPLLHRLFPPAPVTSGAQACARHGLACQRAKGSRDGRHRCQ
jgi:hypothetical protein